MSRALTQKGKMDKHELECGHVQPVKPMNGCAWCPACNALMVVRNV